MIAVNPRLYRGSRPNVVDIGILGYAEFDRIICLEDNLKQINKETGWCKDIDMDFVSIPMDEIKRPSPSTLRQIAYSLDKPIKTFIHCRRGIDRTGYAIAAYRILVCNWTFEEAISECKKYGHRVWFYFWWLKSLRELK